LHVAKAEKNTKKIDYCKVPKSVKAVWWVPTKKNGGTWSEF